MIKQSFLFMIIGISFTLVSNSCAQTVKKNIGIQLYSVKDEMKKDPVLSIEKIGKMGYAFVEAAAYNDGKFYEMEPVLFRKLVEKNGMKFISSHTGRALPDSASWDEDMKWWDVCIDAHHRAGVRYIIQPFMDAKNGFGKLADLKRYCDYFNVIGEKCNKKGIRFGFHNHAKEFGMVDNVIRYDFMLENTDPDKVMFQMDLYWVIKGGADPIEYFNKYPGRFELWHVKDEKEVGESGKIDFKAIFKASETSGMKYPIVEVEQYSSTPMESVKVSFDFLIKAAYVK